MGATASLVMQGAAMLSSASQSYQQGKIARAEGEYAGSVYDQNAALADIQAGDAVTRGRESEGRFRQGTRGLIGTQRANLAAQGIDVGSGTAADLQADAASLGEFDALTIRNNARREAWGFSVDAANNRAAGINARQSGKNIANAMNQQAFSTLLTGASQVYAGRQPSFNRSRSSVPTGTRTRTAGDDWSRRSG